MATGSLGSMSLVEEVHANDRLADSLQMELQLRQSQSGKACSVSNVWSSTSRSFLVSAFLNWSQ